MSGQEQSNQLTPRLQDHQLSTNPRRKLPKKQGTMDGQWTLQQNLKFCLFTDYYQNVFISKEKRKNCHIFKKLSEYIETRSATQCRSRFQKIIKRFHTLFKFRSHYIGEISMQKYAERRDQFLANKAQKYENEQIQKKQTEMVDKGVQTESNKFYESKFIIQKYLEFCSGINQIQFVKCSQQIQ